MVDAEAASLSGGGVVVTYMTADSHSLVADYAVFDRLGELVADGAISGYSTAVTAIPLANGGFVLADAQSDLFGLHATLSLELFNRAGGAQSAPALVDSFSSSTGGAGIQDLAGQAAHGAVSLTFTANGAPEHLTMDLTGPGGVFNADPTAPGHPSASGWL